MGRTVHHHDAEPVARVPARDDRLEPQRLTARPLDDVVVPEWLQSGVRRELDRQVVPAVDVRVDIQHVLVRRPPLQPCDADVEGGLAGGRLVGLRLGELRQNWHALGRCACARGACGGNREDRR